MNQLRLEDWATRSKPKAPPKEPTQEQWIAFCRDQEKRIVELEQGERESHRFELWLLAIIAVLLALLIFR